MGLPLIRRRWLICWMPIRWRSNLRPRSFTASVIIPTARFARRVEGAGEARRREIIDLGLRHRGPHDELPRQFSAGQQFRFDILMDIGGFRDMHRHRRCVQIMQDFHYRAWIRHSAGG
jgi:hypothetical protein